MFLETILVSPYLFIENLDIIPNFSAREYQTPY